MRSTISFIISGLLMASLVAGAQNKLPVKKSFTPTGIRIGTDLIALGKNFAGPGLHGWELNGDIDFANYYLVADIGSWARNTSLPNGAYTNSGSYFRLGVDINLLGKDPDKNMFFFGFRYGRSLFHENLTYEASSQNLYLPTTITLSNGHVTGGWAELTTGLRVKVWSGLWMGYTARMKFDPTTHGNSSAFVPYDMPGYGSVSQIPWWGFNYQIFWKFAWKRDKPLPKN